MPNVYLVNKTTGEFNQFNADGLSISVRDSYTIGNYELFNDATEAKIYSIKIKTIWEITQYLHGLSIIEISAIYQNQPHKS